jgi:hypothetical protein
MSRPPSAAAAARSVTGTTKVARKGLPAALSVCERACQARRALHSTCYETTTHSSPQPARMGTIAQTNLALLMS